MALERMLISFVQVNNSLKFDIQHACIEKIGDSLTAGTSKGRKSIDCGLKSLCDCPIFQDL